jgi:hypothetical protein
VAFGLQVQQLGIDFPEDISQIELALGDVFHLFAAHFAQIPLVASCHHDLHVVDLVKDPAR